MTQLIDLVVTDGLIGQYLQDILNVCFRSIDRSHTGPRESDLGCGHKFIYHIRISRFFTLGKNLRNTVLIIFVKMMDTISIIPENTEIRGCRFQSRKAADCLSGIGDAGGISIHGYTPDTFDGRICADKSLHHIHVRSFLCHGNRDHLNTKGLCNGKMTVISRYRTKEFHLVQLCPGGISHNTVGHGTGYCIKHNIQAGISIYNDIFFRYTGHICHQAANLRNTCETTVVSAVHSGLSIQIAFAVDHIQHAHRQIQLCSGRFSSGHIQL